MTPDGPRASSPERARPTPPEHPGAWEEPLPTLTGRAWAFGTLLTLTDVLPARFTALAPDEACKHVLADLDAGWAAHVAPGDVICVEELHGAGGDGGALVALRQAGIVALVARRYAEGIEDAALAAGIVPITLDAPAFIHTGDRVRLDLEAAKIVNLSSGDRAGIRNLDEPRRAAVRAMLRARVDG
jgi:3-isopropylmalate dehydratase small subunit